jgi:hypothetical protein
MVRTHGLGREKRPNLRSGMLEKLGPVRWKMHAEIAVTSAVKRSPKARLLTAGHLDGRTRASKRARSIAAELQAGFGDEITKVQRQAIERAAVLSVIAEDLVMRRLAGQPVSLDELLRVEGVAKRAIRAVVAERPVKLAVSRGLEIARQRWAEEAAKKATEKPDDRTA